jgi:hypothetical protein
MLSRGKKVMSATPFDSTSLVMFTVVFVVGFVFSLLGVTELAYSIERKKSPWLALISSLLATIVWMSFSLIWIAGATEAMFVGFGYLWFALMWVYVAFTLISVFLILRYSAKPEERGALEIRERTL